MKEGKHFRLNSLNLLKTGNGGLVLMYQILVPMYHQA